MEVKRNLMALAFSAFLAFHAPTVWSELAADPLVGFESDLARVDAWGSMDGEWQGSYRIIHADETVPSGTETTEISPAIKLVIRGDTAEFHIRSPGAEWVKVGESIHVIHRHVFSMFLHIRRSPLWVEKWMVNIDRTSKDEAELSIMRTVNNWRGEVAGPKVFSVFGRGKMSRGMQR